jgi:ribose/xylose/arabinose/galactoside ABC-type transport system permease subunit
MNTAWTHWLRRLSDHGMVLVLVFLCGAFSLFTIREHHPAGDEAAKSLAQKIARDFGPTSRVVLVAGLSAEEQAFTDRLQVDLTEVGATILASARPADVAAVLRKLAISGESVDLIAGSQRSISLLVEGDIPTAFAAVPILQPESYWWPTFLQVSNFRNIANQIAVIAIVAIGMTFVIITGGIDLSVGSQIGLAAIVAALLIRDCFGAVDATAAGMIAASLVGIGVGGLVGFFNGIMVTTFRVPPFVVTLAMMWAVRGLAYILAEGQSVYQIPGEYVWLGRGADLLTIPNAVVLMLALYALAHVLMTRMALGRYLYAVGGNIEAARLAGVPVQRVLLFAYISCGLLAGLGGIILASQQKSAEPSYGQTYELSIIAAVVVGGTSLSGGEGRVFGTLIGAFIIAVIQNGMNMMNIGVYAQWIVFGVVILAAVLLDRLKRRRDDSA